MTQKKSRIAIAAVLFIAALVFIMEKVAVSAKQRAVKPAVSGVLKQNFKLVAIVFGALLIVGVVLMLLFTNTITAILGRMVAMSAALSFVMIFVMLRVLISCAVSIKRK